VLVYQSLYHDPSNSLAVFAYVMSRKLSVTDISRQYVLVKPLQITWKTSQKYYKGVSLSFNQYTTGLETLHYTYLCLMKVITIKNNSTYDTATVTVTCQYHTHFI